MVSFGLCLGDTYAAFQFYPMKYNRTIFSEEDLRRALPFADFSNCALDSSVQGVSTDTRSLEPGNVFIALRGERFDGHNFVEVASTQASLLIIDEHGFNDLAISTPCIVVPDTTRALASLASFHRNRSRTRIVAIAGSNGKTTTKEMCTHILSKYATVCSTHANENNIIGVAGTLLSIEPQHQYAVVEIGTNAPGEIRDLTLMVRPDVCVITTISEEHLSGLGSLLGVAEEELNLFEIMHHTSHVVVNMDCPFTRKFASSKTTTTFGTLQPAEIRGSVTLSPDGATVVHFEHQGKHHTARPGTTGYVAGLNAMAASAVTTALGLPLDMACDALGTYREQVSDAGYARMAIEPVGAITVINDCYNASPASVEAALTTLASMPATPRCAVLGDMFELGEHEHALHQRVIEHALSLTELDALILLGSAFSKAAENYSDERIAIVESHTEAVDAAIEVLSSHGTCLVKGSRGMRMETVIKLIKEEL